MHVQAVLAASGAARRPVAAAETMGTRRASAGATARKHGTAAMCAAAAAQHMAHSCYAAAHTVRVKAPPEQRASLLCQPVGCAAAVRFAKAHSLNTAQQRHQAACTRWVTHRHFASSTFAASSLNAAGFALATCAATPQYLRLCGTAKAEQAPG